MNLVCVTSTTTTRKKIFADLRSEFGPPRSFIRLWLIASRGDPSGVFRHGFKVEGNGMASKAVANEKPRPAWRALVTCTELLVFGSPRKLIRLCENGEIPAKKLGKHWFVTQQVVDSLLEPVEA